MMNWGCFWEAYVLPRQCLRTERTSLIFFKLYKFTGVSSSTTTTKRKPWHFLFFFWPFLLLSLAFILPILKPRMEFSLISTKNFLYITSYSWLFFNFSLCESSIHCLFAYKIIPIFKENCLKLKAMTSYVSVSSSPPPCWGTISST